MYVAIRQSLANIASDFDMGTWRLPFNGDFDELDFPKWVTINP